MATKICVNVGSCYGLQAIIWIKIDLISKAIPDIHLRAISQYVLINLIHNICSDYFL